ncbi:beta-lactamase [Actinoplanes sp. SE50]|uniref:serine hydrolase domain-containing protein n=1 Tax=unclassified Actinoplanes TaxID=2626549 RepID=UPI00023EC46F|nr:MULTISPECIES: serine hydrolase domain-containing protein [unclassified Actinoplanes]AEV84634.1 beta-lactamase [Actinoplanes sp. SE50/110]ATO83026.1 beta-lactamase [Actinoplanes sp. SE50]SLM00434.1 serine hydrolase [Actinoplanes sp. SE50/110]
MNVRWWRALAAASVGVLLTTVGGHGASAAPPTPLQRGLDDLHRLGVAGAQGLIRDGSRVTAARSGVADRDTGAPMPADGYFRIGSDTKTFVSVVLLQLVGEGRITLDDPIENWLPGVVDGHGNDGRHITVRQILQQTSGLYDGTGDLAVLKSADEYRAHRLDHHTEAQLVAAAMQHPPLFPAGTRWSYSNTNYLVAGMLVERVTGRCWFTEVRSRILAPLHLTRTFYPGDRSTLPRPHAEGYQHFTPGGPLIDVTIVNPTVAGSAGGLVSTTTDMARFWQAVTSGRLLPPAQMAEMRRTVPAGDFEALRPGITYGLGIMWVPNRCGGYWAHWGGMPGMEIMEAAAPGGHRSAVFYLTTDLTEAAPVMQRGMTLLDDLICD